MARRGATAMTPSGGWPFSPHRADGTPWLLGILAAILISYLVSPFLFPVVALTPTVAAAAARHALAPLAIGTSALTATIAAAIVVLVGTPCARLLARREFGGKHTLMAFAYLTLALPPFFVGVLLLGILGPHTPIWDWLVTRGVRVTVWWIVVLAQACVSAPYLVITSRVGFEAFDPSLEAVSLALGKPPLVTFFRVSLPLARPWILAAIPLVWLRALSESGAVFAAATPRSVLVVLSGVRSLSNVLPTVGIFVVAG